MWQTEHDQLYKKYTFHDFGEALAFMNKVADIAEDLNHHPTIQNTYNTVELWLSTHEADHAITDKDKAFAKRVDALFDIPKAQSTAIFPRHVKLYGDGGSRGNPGPSASGYVILDVNDNVLYENGVYLGITTNNQAEYQALKFGLEKAHKEGVAEIEVFMDSLLVINQMKGIFKVKNRDLWPIHAAIQELAKQFKHISYTHVPRELNKLADGQVNICLDAQAGK